MCSKKYNKEFLTMFLSSDINIKKDSNKEILTYHKNPIKE